MYLKLCVQKNLKTRVHPETIRQANHEVVKIHFKKFEKKQNSKLNVKKQKGEIIKVNVK